MKTEGKSEGKRVDPDAEIASKADRSRRTVSSVASGKEVKTLPNIAAYVYGLLKAKWTKWGEGTLEQTRSAYREVKGGKQSEARQLLDLFFIPLHDMWECFTQHQVAKPQWSTQDWDRALILFNYHGLYTAFQYYAQKWGWDPLEHSFASFTNFDINTLHGAMLRALKPEQSKLWARILRFKVLNSALLQRWQGSNRAERSSNDMRSYVAETDYFKVTFDYLDVCPRNTDAIKNVIAVASRLDMNDLFDDLRRRAKKAFAKEPNLYEDPFAADDDDFANYRKWYKIQTQTQTQKEVA